MSLARPASDVRSIAARFGVGLTFGCLEPVEVERPHRPAPRWQRDMALGHPGGNRAPADYDDRDGEACEPLRAAPAPAVGLLPLVRGRAPHHRRARRQDERRCRDINRRWISTAAPFGIEARTSSRSRRRVAGLGFGFDFNEASTLSKSLKVAELQAARSTTAKNVDRSSVSARLSARAEFPAPQVRAA